MRGSGTTVKNWLDIGYRATRTTRLTADIRCVNSATAGFWITTNCLSICGGTTTFVISVMRMERKNTTGTPMFLLTCAVFPSGVKYTYGGFC